jgi:hypothetical protein
MNTVCSERLCDGTRLPADARCIKDLIRSLPAWSPVDGLVHVGTMRPQDKGCRGDSHEGHGLSVSECPQAWVEIAGLGGEPWWSLEYKACSSGSGAAQTIAPRFLDLHRVPDAALQAMTAHAAALGWCAPAPAWRLEWHDDDVGEWRYAHVVDDAEAQAEHAALIAELDAGAPSERMPRLIAEIAWALTPALLPRLARRRSDLSETAELVALMLAEDSGHFDGVFWDDRLDALALSAPRAVIFPRRLDRFDVAEIELKELARPRMRA